ncbi:response regulator [Rhodospirillales bacterium YIM 152171]|uniref:Response regulator n=2 Tax=Marinimicrococcus flavescens TaxID=3031815 RepID=A0AAP4D7V0_9PROT|nr:response regulator [Marinimicrococcus flavescens]
MIGGTGQRPRVLLVEDEIMIAMLIEDMLLAIGCEIGATVARVDDALRAARTGAFDLAILDVNLDGKPSYPVADLLKAQGVPFLFATGYGREGLDPGHATAPALQKPFAQADLEAAVARVLAR